MCGICGAVGKDSEDIVRRINIQQHHRGPDDAGSTTIETSGYEVTLGMTRLSILDVEGGVQPMQSQSGRYIIVFNGEIFNCGELRLRLESKGVSFRSHHSDTEVILEGFSIYGEKWIQELNGMFAFAILDKVSGQLLCARDRVGIKPFFFIRRNGRFIFSSEIASLTRFSEAKICNESLNDYFLLGYQIPGKTIFSDIEELKPAEIIRVTADQIISRSSYWEIRLDNTFEYCNDLEERVRYEIHKAIDRWSLSDSRVSVSLSGGVDSAVIAKRLSELLGDELLTFSVKFEDQGDDSDFRRACRLASDLNSEHHSDVITRGEICSDLGKIVAAMGQPYSGSIASWFVYKRVRGHARVIFTGTGGDEICGSYNRWLWFSGLGRRVSRGASLLKSGEHIKDALTSSLGSYYDLVFRDMRRKNILNSEHYKSTSCLRTLTETIRRGKRQRDTINNVSLVGMRYQLPSEFLSSTDIFSMNSSIEARTPFLDHNVIETFFSIPGTRKSLATNSKYLLKKSVMKDLPDYILNAPKAGFCSPVKEALLESGSGIIDYLFSEDYVREQGIFKDDIRSTVDTLMGSKRFRAWNEAWSMISFQMWYETVVKKRSISLD